MQVRASHLGPTSEGSVRCDAPLLRSGIAPGSAEAGAHREGGKQDVGRDPKKVNRSCLDEAEDPFEILPRLIRNRRTCETRFLFRGCQLHRHRQARRRIGVGRLSGREWQDFCKCQTTSARLSRRARCASPSDDAGVGETDGVQHSVTFASASTSFV